MKISNQGTQPTTILPVIGTTKELAALQSSSHPYFTLSPRPGIIIVETPGVNLPPTLQLPLGTHFTLPVMKVLSSFTAAILSLNTNKNCTCLVIIIAEDKTAIANVEYEDETVNCGSSCYVNYGTNQFVKAFESFLKFKTKCAGELQKYDLEEIIRSDGECGLYQYLTEDQKSANVKIMPSKLDELAVEFIEKLDNDKSVKKIISSSKNVDHIIISGVLGNLSCLQSYIESEIPKASHNIYRKYPFTKVLEEGALTYIEKTWKSAVPKSVTPPEPKKPVGIGIMTGDNKFHILIPSTESPPAFKTETMTFAYDLSGAVALKFFIGTGTSITENKHLFTTYVPIDGEPEKTQREIKIFIVLSTKLVISVEAKDMTTGGQAKPVCESHRLFTGASVKCNFPKPAEEWEVQKKIKTAVRNAASLNSHYKKSMEYQKQQEVYTNMLQLYKWLEASLVRYRPHEKGEWEDKDQILADKHTGKKFPVAAALSAIRNYNEKPELLAKMIEDAKGFILKIAEQYSEIVGKIWFENVKKRVEQIENNIFDSDSFENEFGFEEDFGSFLGKNKIWNTNWMNSAQIGAQEVSLRVPGGEIDYQDN